MFSLKNILLVVFILLLIPFIAMQFTTEVNWELLDFIIAGVLLFVTFSIIAIVLKKLKNNPYKNYIILLIFILFLLLWAEMAVGIFGSPIAGN